MLYYCAFTWHAGTTADEVWQRILQQDEAGKNNPDRIRGWYTFAGGGAGFLIVEYDEPRALSRFLTPYMDLMNFDVRAMYETGYDQAIERGRQEYTAQSIGTPQIGGSA